MKAVLQSRFARRRGFTLVELLVVISILSLLLALLMPVLRGAKEQAYLAMCSNNLKNIGQAVLTYASNYNDGKTPGQRMFYEQALSNTSVYGKSANWREALTLVKLMPDSDITDVTNAIKYIDGANQQRGMGAWGCPKWTLENPWTKDSTNYTGWYQVGYGLNNPIKVEQEPQWQANWEAVNGISDTNSSNWFVILDKLKYPDKTIMSHASSSTWGLSRTCYTDQADNDTAYRWHGGRGTKVWYDGHVDVTRYTDIYNLTVPGTRRLYYCYDGILGQW